MRQILLAPVIPPDLLFYPFLGEGFPVWGDIAAQLLIFGDLAGGTSPKPTPTELLTFWASQLWVQQHRSSSQAQRGGGAEPSPLPQRWVRRAQLRLLGGRK